MASDSGQSLLKDVPVCSVCLDVFSLPRQLPCMHSFCSHCLQGYISNTVGNKGRVVEEFVCPVCRTITNPPKIGKPIGLSASLYPRSTISMTAKSKAKVERYCDDCQYVDEFNTAQVFCVVCEEYLCDPCLAAHKKAKMTRDHKLISTEELNSTPENQIRFANGFGCPNHQDKRMEYYCQSHEAACCADCFFSDHRSCDQVKNLNKDLPYLLSDLMPEKIMEHMKTIEKHLETFILTNESNISKVEATINNLTDHVRAVRKMVNERLDEVERLVKTEGSRICKVERIRQQEENRQCQCLINAVRNSHTFLESVIKYGTDAQKFLASKKSIAQLKAYTGRIREKYENIESVVVCLEFSGLINDIISQDVNRMARLLSKEDRKYFPYLGISDDHYYFNASKPVPERQVKLANMINIQFRHKGSPYHSDIVQLPGGDLVLADSNNNTCCLYNSSYNFITSYDLPEGPWEICLIGDSEVAVTLPDMKTIQFLSIRDHSIRDTGRVKTVCLCSSIAAINREDIVVTGPTNDRKKCYWSLVSRTAGEIRHHEFDCPGVYWTHVTLNNSKLRVYISEYQSNAVRCFDLTNGTLYFVYTSNDLCNPLGLAVDWKDNVYVVGYNSHNIHKLSPEGTPLQVITSAVLQHPIRIFFSWSRGHFIVTNNNPGQRNTLHMFIQQ